MPRIRLAIATALVGLGCADATAPVGPDSPSLQVTPPSVLPCLPCAQDLEAFSRPFDIAAPAINLFDHELPLVGSDPNPRFRFTWAESVTIGSNQNEPILINGHDGYDWKMPIGTRIKSVAAGRVVGIINGQPGLTCPFPAPDPAGNKKITIEHQLHGGIVVRSVYMHLSRIDVALNQTVSEGQLIGLSGQTGCAKGPHLHLAVIRMVTPTQPVVIDPYGWRSYVVSDPWISGGGTASINLWRQGQEPSRRLTLERPIAAGFNAGITSVAWMGPNDNSNPNNEELVVTFNGGANQVFTVARLHAIRSGLAPFAINKTISASQPRLHIFTGSGTSNDTTVYLGRSSGIWSNAFDDCARIEFANGNFVNFGLGASSCP